MNVVLTKKTSNNARVYPSYIFILITFIVSAALAKTDTSKWTFAFFEISVICGMVGKIGMGFLNATGAIFAHFPPRYMNAFMQGQALAGTLVAVLNIISMAVFTKEKTVGGKTVLEVDDPNTALMTFLVATVVILVCVVAYHLLSRLQFARKYWIDSRPVGAHDVRY